MIEKDGRAYVLVILLQAPGRESAAVAAGAIARASKEILAAVSDLDGGPPR